MQSAFLQTSGKRISALDFYLKKFPAAEQHREFLLIIILLYIII